MSHAFLLVAVEGPKSAVGKQVAEQLAPFDENGQWFRDGSRWDWWVVGGRYEGRLPKSTIKVAELRKCIDEFTRTKAIADWQAYLDERPEFKPFWEMPNNATEDSYVATKVRNKLSAYAFLKGGIWHENERMGFFGAPATTECEAAGRDKGKCIVGDIKNPPAIIGFNEPTERWQERFWSRFIAPLPDDWWLVAVDYHV